MRFFGRRRKAVAVVDRAETKRELEAAEQRLAHDHEHVTLPLADLRKENHIAPRLSMLIQRKARELRDGGG
jgi:hypothetical protein